jgi:hypothetical protein
MPVNLTKIKKLKNTSTKSGGISLDAIKKIKKGEKVSGKQTEEASLAADVKGNYADNIDKYKLARKKQIEASANNSNANYKKYQAAQKEQEAKDFVDNLTAQKAGVQPVDIRNKNQNFFTDPQALRKPLTSAAITALDIASRPANAVVNALKEQNQVPEYVKVDGKMYKVSQGVREKNVAGAFVRGLAGQDRPEALEIAAPKSVIEKAKKEHPVLTGISEFTLATVTDPTTYIGGEALKVVAKKILGKIPLQITQKLAKGTAKVEDIAKVAGKTEEEVQKLLDNEAADLALSKAKFTKQWNTAQKKKIEQATGIQAPAKVAETPKATAAEEDIIDREFRTDTFDKWNRTQKWVDDIRKTDKKINTFEHYWGHAKDTDRGYARYIDKYFDEMPDDLKGFWGRQRVKDLETGEMNLGYEGVRGGHVGQVRNYLSEIPEYVPEQFKGASPGEPGYKPVKVGMQTQIVDTSIGKTQPFKYADPELEKIHLQNKGIKTLTPVEKIKELGTDIKNMLTRPIKTLPYTKANAELYKELIKLPKLRNMAADDTVRVLDDLTKKMDKNSFDIFQRKVFLDDLAEETKLGNALPNKWTSETIDSELQRLDAAMPQTVRDAVTKRQTYWDGIKDEYITAMKGMGIDLSDTLTRENYFRHQVLEYMDAKNSYMGGTGKKLKTPANRGFTKSRTGEYEGNINTDYLQAEYEVMAQMKHDTGVARTIKNIETNYSITDKLKADAKAQGIKDWHELIPEGYETWQPREGNVFYMSQPLGAQVVEQALALRGLKLSGIKDPKIKVALEDIMNDLADQTPVLAMGGKRKEFVVKNEVAETLNNLTKVKTTNVLSRASKSVQNTWKRWILTLNPKSVIKYNIRNFSGDLDAIIAGNPGTIKKTPKASKELFDAMQNGKFTPELKGWYDRGGYQSLLQAQEISQVNKLKPFEKFRDMSVAEKITKPLKSYAEFTKNVTNYREAVGRYAAYLDYLDQLKGGKLKNYGSSRPAIVDGLKSNEDKAFKLSNDLLGAYDEVSEAGQIIRNHLIPFYSWMEINMKRYKNLFKNAVTNKEVGKVAGLSAKLVAKLGYKTATKLAGIFAMTTALAAWNQLKYPELEETLSDDVRARPHIILGQDDKGNTLYFSRMGALNDFAEWFGMGNAPQDVRDMINGKLTVQDFLVNMVKSPVNKIAGGITPIYKTTAELAFGQKAYPDVFNTTPIRDRKQHAASALGLKNEYDVLAGKPHRPYFENLNDALLYKTDPEEQAYYSILDLKAKFKERITGEKRSGGLYTNKKSDALYNWKLSLKYGDEEAKKKYIKEYFKLGGTTDGIKDSLASLNPLYGIKKELQPAFVNSLDVKEKEKLKQAMKYYNELIKSTSKK